MARTVLVVTALEDVTADWVVAALNERGVPVVRVDPADIGPRLAFAFRIGPGEPAWSGPLRTESREVDLREIGAVYHRRPTPYRDRFARLPRQERDYATGEARHGLGGVLRSLRSARYVNHPAAVARAEFKPGQLQKFVELGLRVPATLVTNDAAAARQFAQTHPSVVCKTFRGLPPGEDGRTGAIWTQRVRSEDFDDSLAVTAHLFQAEVPKDGDVRITVVGRRVFAQRITGPRGAVDWRCGDWNDLVHAPVAVPAVVEDALHGYLAAAGLVFGCFDFALTGDGSSPDDWWAIECNPNGQWGWLPDAPAITEAFADILSMEGTSSSS